jgi:hypothetical protein
MNIYGETLQGYDVDGAFEKGKLDALEGIDMSSNPFDCATQLELYFAWGKGWSESFEAHSHYLYDYDASED